MSCSTSDDDDDDDENDSDGCCNSDEYGPVDVCSNLISKTNHVFH